MSDRRRRVRAGFALAAALCAALPASAQEEAPREPQAGFARRAFYLHGSWVMRHPFAVRTWQLEDFRHMFRLLRSLDFTCVMWWPTPEVAPLPLSEEDAETLRGFRAVVDAAHEAGLECWVAYCASVVSGDEVRGTPWPQRSLYSTMHVEKAALDDERTAAYLAHRTRIVQLLDNADGLVVIDGDPGGYPGAPVEEYARILQTDQAALGTATDTALVPWVWCGWGRDTGGEWFWTHPVEPTVRAELAMFPATLREPWELIAGRSHREGWANGRTNVQLIDEAGLMPRATIMCYESIEFEPTPPAGELQLDLIRDALRQEAQYRGIARGVMGNAQQAIMVLPNLYFFARAAADPSYLERADAEVLADLALALGGDIDDLSAAWSAPHAPLEALPADLPARLRAMLLTAPMAQDLPGGPRRYVELLATLVQSRRDLLLAAGAPLTDADAAAAALARGSAALVAWWREHRYVGFGRAGDPFRWGFVDGDQTALLRGLAARCAAVDPSVEQRAARKLVQGGWLPADEALARVRELTAR